MDKTKILEIIDKINKGTPAKNFEDLHLDVKRYLASPQEGGHIISLPMKHYLP